MNSHHLTFDHLALAVFPSIQLYILHLLTRSLYLLYIHENAFHA